MLAYFLLCCCSGESTNCSEPQMIDFSQLKKRIRRGNHIVADCSLSFPLENKNKTKVYMSLYTKDYSKHLFPI